MTGSGVINNIKPLSAMYGVCSHDLRIRNENCTSFVLISKLFFVCLVTFCEKMALPMLNITLPILVLYVMTLLSMQFCVAVNFSVRGGLKISKISITVKHITTRSPWGEGRETHLGEGDREANRGGEGGTHSSGETEKRIVGGMEKLKAGGFKGVSMKF